MDSFKIEDMPSFLNELASTIDDLDIKLKLSMVSAYLFGVISSKKELNND